MEKEKNGKCCVSCSTSCGSMDNCSYGGYSQHSALRLLVVLLVMMLIFFLGMQVGELKSEVSGGRGYEMRYQKMQMKEMPSAMPGTAENN